MIEKPAILGGVPSVQMPFPKWPQGGEMETNVLKQVVESGEWWKMSGTQVSKFEKDFAEYHGAKYAIATTNGTHALELALRSLGIGPGDEVIIPSLTFIATATAVFMTGALPVPVDVDIKTWCMDPEEVKRVITPKTKAIIPVHFAGQIAQMDELSKIAIDNGIVIIEDAAHAHGAKWNKKSAGSFGLMAAFSFQNYKLLTAGEGGMLLINDAKVLNSVELVSNCGRPRNDKSYRHILLGGNFRMSEFQGAVLNCQLTKLKGQSEIREKNAAWLIDKLKVIPGIYPQERFLMTDVHAYYMLVFTFDPNEFEGLSRENFVQALCKEGIPAFRMYPVVQDTLFFPKSYSELGGDFDIIPDCPNGRYLAERGVWIHHQVLLGNENAIAQVFFAIERIKKYALDIRIKIKDNGVVV